MAQENTQRTAIEAELQRTAFQRKVVTNLTMQEVFDDAVTFFRERGYRAGRTGRPNQLFVMGGREGQLPRVTAEMLIQTGVGKSKVTMISISGAGEQLSQALEDYAGHLRALRASARSGESGNPENGWV